MVASRKQENMIPYGVCLDYYTQRKVVVYCDCMTLITTTTAVRKLLLSVFITAVDAAVVEGRNNGWLSLSWLACLPEMKAQRTRLINTQLEIVHLSGIFSTQQNDFKRRDRKDCEDNDVLFYRFSFSLLVLFVDDEDDHRK